MAANCRWCRVLLPRLSPLVVEDIWRVDGVVIITAHPRARGARCGQCGRISTRVHSSYRRRLADLPVAGHPAVVRLLVRRFFCGQDDCRAGTFVEQVPGLTHGHAQRTAGAQDALLAIALALAGRAGSRLATALGMPVSRSTLVGRIPDHLQRTEMSLANWVAPKGKHSDHRSSLSEVWQWHFGDSK